MYVYYDLKNERKTFQMSQEKLISSGMQGRLYFAEVDQHAE